jgi:hypothetical protein
MGDAMSLRDVVLTHAPDIRYLIGVVPDEELAERAIKRAAEIAVEDAVESMYTEDQMDDAKADTKVEVLDEVKDDLFHILDVVEWETADDLAKLIREALEAL